jgi:predicted nucleic acid-binding protein
MTLTKLSVDSNVLIYASLEPKSEKGERASWLIRAAAPRLVIATQALLEYVAVVRRKRPQFTSQAIAQAAAWAAVAQTVATTDAVQNAAMQLVQNHQFQVWDAVIWAAAASAGCSFLYSEDLQDGFRHAGLEARNPFARAITDLA